MKVKVGDTVKIIAGKDKGKEGKVIKTYKTLDKVVVEGLNIVKKHSKPRTNQDKGGIFDVEAPIHVSNVKVITNNKEEKAKVKEVKNSEEKVTKKKTSAKKETK
ncbi:MAG: 50S ribosomal protein L24 [Bacilli bacterium]